MVSDRQLTFRSCLFGAILGTLGCAAIYYFGLVAVGDLPMRIALFLPAKVGLVDEVDEQDMITLQPDVVQSIDLPARGKYELFTFDGRPTQYDLTIHSASGGDGPHVAPAAAVSGQATPLTAVALPEEIQGANEAGLYLSHVVRVSQPGSYQVLATGQSARASDQELILVRSVANQNAAVAIFGGLIQAGLIVAILWLVYRFLNRGKLRARKEVRQHKANQWQALFSAADSDEDVGTNK